MKMPPRSIPKPYRISSFFAEDSHARLFQLLESGMDLTMLEEPFSLKLPESLPLSDHLICSLKMFPDCYRMTKAGHLRSSSIRWRNWGMMSAGRCLTARILVFLNPERECSLSDFLERCVSARYCLSQNQILRLLSKSCPEVKGIVFMTLPEYLSLLQAVPEASEEKQDYMLNLPPKGSSNQEGVELPVKVLTKSGYQIATPGDSIDTSYPGINSRRSRAGKKVAHTLTCTPTQAVFIDLNTDPKITAHARCLTTRIDAGIGKHKGERSGVLMMGPRAVLTPDRDEVRQQGRRIKEEEEPMYTLMAQDRHGVWWLGVIRRLTPLECFRLQGFTDAQFFKVAALGLKDGQLYKLAGNAVSVPVISALGLVIKSIEAQYQLERMCNS